MNYSEATNTSTTIEWIGYVTSKIKQETNWECEEDEANWWCAAFCSALVGLAGLFPIFFLPNDHRPRPRQQQEQQSNSQESNNNKIQHKSEGQEGHQGQGSCLRFMLAFAVGGLLGDVFLHLLPEAFSTAKSHDNHTYIGLLVIAGLLAFMIAEKVVGRYLESADSQVSASGYLNLVANCVDNFSHGLAVGGAFLVNTKAGIMTTMCILIHEIPHEVGDFAILMKSGFTRYEAAKAQFSTAFVGIAGAILALTLDTVLPVDSVTFFIVPFTSGGFLHIALVSVLPDLMDSSEGVNDCIRVFSGIILGITTMLITSCL